ncbi:NAD(+) synthase [Candidatus Parcubacteria bacterium]|jgi:nicotinamide-nucleotide amidase|nr:NAD(+) synthase [Candidatus Parcubacteria bacterium]
MKKPGILEKDQCEAIIGLAASSLYEYCEHHGIHYVVTGSSGGLDSAVTLALAQRACKMAAENDFDLTSVGLIMPCHSDESAERLGKMVIEKFGAEQITIDLTSNFDYATNLIDGTNSQITHILRTTGGVDAIDQLDWSKNIAQGNIKARMRMMFGTYHVARMMNGMVLSTDNLSEFWMAFWTICGDVGDYGMIQSLLKGLELYDLADCLGVPKEIINSKPDDGLNVGNGDEDQLGASYPVLDLVMIELIHQGFDPDGSLDQLMTLPSVEGVDQDVVVKLAKRCLRGSFKRHGPIVLSRAELGLAAIKNLDLDMIQNHFRD